MTAEETKQSYMFKIVRRALMKEYPWINDVQLDDNEFDSYKYSNFIYLTINPIILGEEQGWDLAPWTIRNIKNNKPEHSPVLGLYFKGGHDYKSTVDELNDFTTDICRSPAIPDELKLPKPKNTFYISGYDLTDNLTIQNI
jgi:hypothetical protein